MKKKKILLLSDDLRMHSGVATQSKELVVNSLHKYDWAQLGGAINHPEHGKVIDLSDTINKDLKDKLNGTKGYLRIYPTTGYGEQNQLRQIIQIEKPDAILHYTDPRFWVWLYQMEHEIRQSCPIMYYNIWDDLPDPLYNTNYYRSSDLLMGISKQTYGINHRILSKHGYEDWQLKYVPHGVSKKRISKVELPDDGYQEFKSKLNIDNYKFKLLYLNRNIRRKQPGDVLLAYKYFMDGLTEEQRKECIFVFHAAPVDDNGTDMRAVHKAICPEYPVHFTYDLGMHGISTKQVSYLYNICDVYINLASNEGFGLGSLEALTCGKPVIVNVTGGLQDQ